MVETGNTPAFDPLNPSPDEERDMVAGYREAGPAGCGFRPTHASAAYELGWQVRRNVMALVASAEHIQIARRIRVSGRSALTAQSGREGRDG